MFIRVKFFYETDGLTRKNFERNKTDQLTLTKKNRKKVRFLRNFFSLKFRRVFMRFFLVFV